MRRFLFTIISAATLFTAGAQMSVEEILRSVEHNNKELRANRQLVAAQLLESGRDNNLPDPTVSYSHLYGNREGMGFTGELIASQSFDFPSLYVQRKKLLRAEGENYTRQGEEVRQQILLQAKEVCLDLVLLNRQQQLLDLRLQNAERLSALYAERIEEGDANVLDANKINLELLNVRNEARMNETARADKLQELAALNGGIAIQFADTAYAPVGQPASYADLLQEVMASDRRLQSLRSTRQAALRRISVSKAKGLPSFELGYRMNPSSGGQRYNGFLVGISIPIFSNRNNVRQAKAQSLYADLQLESTANAVENELMQLYNRSVALKTSIDEYRTELEKQNTLFLLDKAIRSGRISIIEYFADAATFYQSLQNYMQLQNEYQKVMARIYKCQL